MEEQDDPPKPLLEKGELFQDLVPVWEAFWTLHPARQSGGGLLMSDIVFYWRDLMGVVNQEDLKYKTLLVRKMDNEYLKVMREKSDGV